GIGEKHLLDLAVRAVAEDDARVQGLDAGGYVDAVGDELPALEPRLVEEPLHRRLGHVDLPAVAGELRVAGPLNAVDGGEVALDAQVELRLRRRRPLLDEGALGDVLLHLFEGVGVEVERELEGSDALALPVLEAHEQALGAEG